MRIILTDITQMRGDSICIAGWSIEDRLIVRPVRQDAKHWTETLMGYIPIEIGDVVDFRLVRAPFSSSYPHATEDRLVSNEEPEYIETLEKTALLSNIGPTHNTVSSIFGNNLLDGKYVPFGTKCASLGSIDIPSSDLKFVTYDNKLKCIFRNDERDYGQRPVTSIHLNTIYLKEGIAGLNRRAQRSSRARIFLGLARKFTPPGQPEGCYMQVNNVLFY